jgi:hypothetical protein
MLAVLDRRIPLKSGLFGRFSPGFGGFVYAIEWDDVRLILKLEALPFRFLASTPAKSHSPAPGPSQKSQFCGIPAMEDR